MLPCRLPSLRHCELAVLLEQNEQLASEQLHLSNLLAFDFERARSRMRRAQLRVSELEQEIAGLKARKQIVEKQICRLRGLLSNFDSKAYFQSKALYYRYRLDGALSRRDAACRAADEIAQASSVLQEDISLLRKERQDLLKDQQGKDYLEQIITAIVEEKLAFQQRIRQSYRSLRARVGDGEYRLLNEAALVESAEECHALFTSLSTHAAEHLKAMALRDFKRVCDAFASLEQALEGRPISLVVDAIERFQPSAGEEDSA